MNTNKHTPGPWTVEYGADNSCNITAPADDGFQTRKRLMDANAINDQLPGVRPHINWEADARLIAAAPELLEALAIAEAWISDTQLDFDLTDNGTLESVRAAIAKAKGE